MLVLYGLMQPYKSRVANVVELIVQANFFILLALESISFLSSTLSPSQIVQKADTNLNETDICEDETTRISIFTTIQLIVFYLPLLLFIAVALIKLTIYIRWVILLHLLYRIYNSVNCTVLFQKHEDVN